MNTIIANMSYTNFIQNSKPGYCLEVARYLHVNKSVPINALIEGDKIIFLDQSLKRICSVNNSEKDYDNTLINLSEHMSEIGKFVICTDNDGNGRLRIHKSDFMDYYTKNGWWDTFTLSSGGIKTEVGKMYLSKIVKLTTDKEGYTIAIVEPITEIDRDLCIYLSKCTRYQMSIEYVIHSDYSNLNISAAYYEVPEDEFFSDPCNKDIHERIRKALHSKTREELERDAIRELAKTNPVVADKISKKGINEYIYQIHDRYYILLNRGEIKETDDIVEKCLSTEAYYQRLKEEKKEKKKNKAAN